MKDLTVSECRINTKEIFFKKKSIPLLNIGVFVAGSPLDLAYLGLYFDNGFSNTGMLLKKYRNVIYVERGQMS